MRVAKRYLLIISLSLILLASFTIYLLKVFEAGNMNLHSLIGGDFTVIVDKKLGIIKVIKNQGDIYGTNFARNEEEGEEEGPRLGSIFENIGLDQDRGSTQTHPTIM